MIVIKKIFQNSQKDLYGNAVSFIDKMASKNLIHKNNAARQKSKITNHLNSLSK